MPFLIHASDDDNSGMLVFQRSVLAMNSLVGTAFALLWTSSAMDRGIVLMAATKLNAVGFTYSHCRTLTYVL